LVTVVGHSATIAAGEWITATGEWVNDRTHGQQFKARFLRTSAPTSTEGIEKYLSSGMIRGIGPVYARKLVRAFAEKVFDVIEAEPDRLREVDGIGPVRAQRIVAAWAEQKVVREIMVFLHSHGVGTARAVRIFKIYGADAVQFTSENPYRLARDIRGIGFKTADAIAMKLGIEKTAMVRVRAGISYALTEAMDDGHCGLPTDELFSLAERLLEVPVELVRTALDLELADGTVVADTVGETACVFLAGLHRAERNIADRLLGLLGGSLPWPWIDPDTPTRHCCGSLNASNSPLPTARRLRSGRRWPAKRWSSLAAQVSARPPSLRPSCASCPPKASSYCCAHLLVARPSA
jgi:exodeoxyribonuclease V alpha subunit